MKSQNSNYGVNFLSLANRINCFINETLFHVLIYNFRNGIEPNTHSHLASMSLKCMISHAYILEHIFYILKTQK